MNKRREKQGKAYEKYGYVYQTATVVGMRRCLTRQRPRYMCQEKAAMAAMLAQKDNTVISITLMVNIEFGSNTTVTTLDG